MRGRGMMSDTLKTEIAKEIGIYDVLHKHGWGVVSSCDCRNTVNRNTEIENGKSKKIT